MGQKYQPTDKKQDFRPGIYKLNFPESMPVSQKPVLFTIVCDLPDGRKGYFSQRFK